MFPSNFDTFCRKYRVCLLMVIDMELTVYALQKGFSSFLNTHPEFVAHMDKFPLEQQEKFVQLMQEEEIKERAIAYFDDPHIYLKDHTLYYENSLRSMTYKIKVETNCIRVYEQEGNPFFPFLKRIFRELLTCSKGYKEETNIKVL